MQFIKKHYEKVVLGAVLLGLTAALAYLPVVISKERQQLEDNKNQIVNLPVKELPALDLGRPNGALQRVQTAFVLNFSGDHNLFNPVRWQKAPDGRLVREQNIDPMAALAVTKINPLRLVVTFDSTNSSGYVVKMLRETKLARNEREVGGILSPDKPKIQNLILLREVKGGGDQPIELVLDMIETNERISVAIGKPFSRVDGYEVDLRTPEGRTLSRQREGSTVAFGGEVYTIKSIKEIAPGEYEIVLSAKSTEKKTAKRFKV